MPSDLMSIITSGGKSATASGSGVSGTGSSARGEMPKNPLIDALTERLLKQSEGISSSSSSQLQSEIASAMAGVTKAGESTAARIQSERDREMGYARDAASATYTGALEGRTGYATQVSALRELTNTTEKSIRDLDQRYQEALLTNDANTASQLSELRVQKLKFQQEQEQNFFTNIMSVANLQQSAIDSMMRREEFWAGQEQQQNQFVMSMAQSAYQFEQNLGVSYKELGLKEQELDIARERNAISRDEYNLKKGEINREKTNTTLQSIAFDRIKGFVLKGGKLDEKDSIQWQSEIMTELLPMYPALAEMRPEEVASFIESARLEVANGIKAGTIIPPKSTTTTSGRGGYTLSDAWNYVWSGNKSSVYDSAQTRAANKTETIMSPETYWGKTWH
jgi:hypothetical protein